MSCQEVKSKLKDKYFSIKISTRTLISLLVIVPILILGFKYWGNIPGPQYIVLDPPVQHPIISEEKWIYDPSTSGNIALGNDKLWIWRRTYHASITVGDARVSEVFRLDQWFNERGWKKLEEVGSHCEGMGATDFPGSKDLFAYVPKVAIIIQDAPIVCVGIWRELTPLGDGFSSQMDTTVVLFSKNSWRFVPVNK